MVERGQRVKLGAAGRPARRPHRGAVGARGAGEPRRGARRRSELADARVRAHEVAARQGRDHEGRVRPPEHAVLDVAVEQVAAGAGAQRDDVEVGAPTAWSARRSTASSPSSDVSPGEWVTPGKPLFTLVDDDPLQDRAVRCPRRRSRDHEAGQDVDVVAVAHPDKKFHADDHALGAEIGKTRSLIVEATLDKGTRPRARHVRRGARRRSARRRASCCPTTAVVKRGKTWHAFVDSRTARRGPHRPARHRRRRRSKVAIIQGIARATRSSRRSPTRSSTARRSME